MTKMGVYSEVTKSFDVFEILVFGFALIFNLKTYCLFFSKSAYYLLQIIILTIVIQN
jgi:hypothetical protein